MEASSLGLSSPVPKLKRYVFSLFQVVDLTSNLIFQASSYIPLSFQLANIVYVYYYFLNRQALPQTMLMFDNTPRDLMQKLCHSKLTDSMG